MSCDLEVSAEFNWPGPQKTDTVAHQVLVQIEAFVLGRDLSELLFYLRSLEEPWVFSPL